MKIKIKMGLDFCSNVTVARVEFYKSLNAYLKPHLYEGKNEIFICVNILNKEKDELEQLAQMIETSINAIFDEMERLKMKKKSSKKEVAEKKAPNLPAIKGSKIVENNPLKSKKMKDTSKGYRK
jgi:hypothetical protein